MASYADLFDLLHNEAMLGRITVAVGVAADIIWTETDTGDSWDETNHGNRILWAVRAFANPTATARDILWAVVIKNRTYTVEQILEAADETVQDAVNLVVDLFARGS